MAPLIDVNLYFYSQWKRFWFKATGCALGILNNLKPNNALTQFSKHGVLYCVLLFPKEYKPDAEACSSRNLMLIASRCVN